ncbi:hypothetical protein FPV67DRAFT_1777345 [Lyophyllum atratum]|nr:hypothetical protein FPV67DRAFT_1777345 [Lyophyllum atratum]
MTAPRLDAQTNFPCAFQCTSGELLFGQMQCIVEGMRNNSHDGINGPTLLEQGGTIVQHGFKYRVAARVGRWVVSRIYLDDREPQDDNTEHWHIGYILHHEDVSPVEYVLRASKVGMSNHNDHPDRAIVYVNRYDWSWHHGRRATINIAMGTSRPYTRSQTHELMGGRLIVFDASQGETFIETVKSPYPEKSCYSLRAAPNEAPYGVHLDAAKNDPEYELGWLGFSGKKHDKFSGSDELVVIIYDPAYVGFSEDYMNYPPRVIVVEDTVVTDERTDMGGGDVVEDDEDYIPEDESDAEATSEGSETSEASSLNMLEDDEISSLAQPDIVPAPVISGVVVNLDAALNVIISGSTLGQVTSVTFGDVPTSIFTVSNTLVEARAPPQISGEVGVSVSGVGGTSNVFPYTHPAVAIITQVSPNQGSRWGGDIVTLSGHHLDRTTSVIFGSQPAIIFQIISDTEIRATTPAGPGSCRQTVTLESLHQVEKVAPRVSYAYERDEVAPVRDPEYTAAITTWRAAIDRKPDDVQARKFLAEAFAKKGDESRAIEIRKEIVGLEAGSLTALDGLAKAYASDAQYSEAIEAWKAAIEAGSDAKHVFLGLADAYGKGRQKKPWHYRALPCTPCTALHGCAGPWHGLVLSPCDAARQFLEEALSGAIDFAGPLAVVKHQADVSALQGYKVHVKD